ncbi:MAG: D-alanine--D-alanine ligase [Myxococcota bacterium]
MSDATRCRVAVIWGGPSSEAHVSEKTSLAVEAALQRRGHDVVRLELGPDLAESLRSGGFDVAWLAVHGPYGEDGCLQGLLEILALPYTGSDVLSSALAMDKHATKRALRDHDDVVMAADKWVDSLPETLDGFPLPSIVKPTCGGSTIGMTVVQTTDALREAIQDALTYDVGVLVEALVVGREITVAVLDGEALPVVAIDPADGFFDFEAKYTKGKTTYTVPADVSDAVAASAQRAAVAAYQTLKCRGLARADFLVNENDEPVFLEINTLPGMTPTSLSPMAAGAVGISFDELTERIMWSARCRTRRLVRGEEI